MDEHARVERAIRVARDLDKVMEMAPPLPLSTVAGTLALSFTAGRAAPATASPPVQEPTSVPAPPMLPPLPGETEPTEPATPEPDATVTTEPATPTPATPEPPAEVEPLMPIPPPELDEIELPDGGEDDTAAASRLLRPNHRPFMFNLFVGGSRSLRGGAGYSFLNDFNVEGAIGGFGRNFRAGGFAVVQMSKGLPFTTFTLAPRLSLNRQIVPDHAFYFTTNLTLGYRASTYRDTSTEVYDGYGQSYGSSDERTTYHSAVMGVSWGASAIIAERLVLSFRPVDVEMVVPSTDDDTLVQLNWCIMGGLGVVWGGPGDDHR